MYIVFHRKPLYPGLVFRDQDPLLAELLGWPALYQEVAQVEAENLEVVYVKTQHLETPWWWRYNQGVKALQMSRSTSIGDILQDEQNNLWAVAATGFVRVIEHKKERL